VGRALRADAPGWVAAASTGGAGGAPGAVRLLPAAGGALLGKKIALDPLGDDSDTTGVMSDTAFARAWPDSLARLRRAMYESDADLRVARALREYLEAAGARVTMTRDSPASLSAVDRLRRVEAASPDRVVVLGRRGGTNGATAGHYFSSPGGKALAQRIVKRYDDRDAAGSTRVLESADYVVQQTGAVAVLVHGPNPEPLYVDRTRGARQLREEAYAIFLALAEDLGADPKKLQNVRVKVAHQGAAEGGVPVRLDGRWTLLTNDKGECTFECLPDGARFAVVAGEGATTASARVTTPAKDAVVLDLGPASPGR
jgi:N-acetylmuramoyl-L-alanine amidase